MCFYEAKKNSVNRSIVWTYMGALKKESINLSRVNFEISNYRVFRFGNRIWCYDYGLEDFKIEAKSSTVAYIPSGEAVDRLIGALRIPLNLNGAF